jgi:hypothetical protein
MFGDRFVARCAAKARIHAKNGADSDAGVAPRVNGRA